MDPVNAIVHLIDVVGLNPIISLPCKYTAALLNVISRKNNLLHIPVTREEEGVGIACGAYLAGKRPLLIIQNSGLGNSINAVASLSNYYKIPLVFIISHRGTEGETIDAQRPMGEITPLLLELLSIPSMNILHTEAIVKAIGFNNSFSVKNIH